MKKLLSMAAPVALALALVPLGSAQAATAPTIPPAAMTATPLLPMPQARSPGRHINRVVDMWVKGQPVYYTGQGAGDYEAGKKLAATQADYINYNLEHDPLDFTKLRAFMQGLIDAGQTRSGHRMPTVIVVLPISGTLEAVRANTWMIQQTLATGVHGILLVNAESPAAVQAMIEASRYPFQPKIEGLAQGTRGNGSQGNGAEVWGISAQDYMQRADVWPDNPNGELIFGVKIENPRAVVNVEAILGTPGLAFAEWGPGDNGFYLLGMPQAGGRDVESIPVMAATRARVLAAAKANKIMFLNSCNENNVQKQIDDGVMICTGGDSPAAAKGRAYTKRTDPW